MQKRYPFKFLDAYTRADSDFYFGRSDEINALYEMVFQTDLLLVYGASGTGKSSLIQCGLASKFQSHDWLALNIRRGDDLNESFEKALDDAGGFSEGVTSSHPLTDFDWLDDELSNDQPQAASKILSPLARRFKAIYLKHFKPVYLIFDQFEELYILGNQSEQRQFVETVQEILRVEQPVKIILSIREEYLGHLYEFERAVPELLRKKLRVEPMNLDKVKTVIQRVGAQPAGNVRLQPGEEADIAEAIFEKIRGDEKTLHIPLPYLQVFLDKLYLQITDDKTRQAEAVFSMQAMSKIGDLGDVLRNFLDEQVRDIAPELGQPQEMLWQALSPFVTLDGTKEPLSEAQLADKLPDAAPDFVRRALQAFVKGRILRFSEATQRYEIAHDALAKQIHAKRSDEEIAILEVQRLVKSQTAMKAEAREFFTEKQLLFMEPYLAKFNPSAEENDWIARSRAEVLAQKEAAALRQAEELENARTRAIEAERLTNEAFEAKQKAEDNFQIAQEKSEEAQQQKAIAEEQSVKAEQGRKRARTFSYLAGLVAVVAIGVGVYAFFKQREARTASDLAKTEENRAKDALTQVEKEKEATETQRKNAEASAALAKQKAAEAEAANALAQTSLAKAKTEEAKAKAALEQVGREKNATEAQRKKAEDSFLLAQEKTKEAEKEAENARRALDEQKKAVAAQQAALANVVRLTLKEADKKIYTLDYEAALDIIQSAAALNAAPKEVAENLLEIAFFFAETGKFDRAKSILDTVATLAGDLSTLKKLINPNTREGLRDAIKSLYPDRLTALDARYFPIMMPIPGGTETLGSDNDDEKPRHVVTLAPFKMAKTETTWWQYNLFCEATGKEKPDKPGWGSDGDNPVVNVSWYDAVEFANWLSLREGRNKAIEKIGSGDDERYEIKLQVNGYRLPTESEWEYAARAHTTLGYAGSNNLDSVAWYSNNSGSRTRPAAGKRANTFGLYDMSGNVWEWCWDWYGAYDSEAKTNPTGPEKGGLRVLRGGGWYGGAEHCRVSNRYGSRPTFRYNDIGFRLSLQ